MTIKRVISGGQTGVDQAGLRAAKRCGIPTGGWMPNGFLTEDGERRDLATDFGVDAIAGGTYPARTKKNVEEADATLWIGPHDSTGGRLTLECCKALKKRHLVVNPVIDDAATTADWIRAMGQNIVLNVAGNRESASPGIGAQAEEFLIKVFRAVAGDPAEPSRESP